MRMAASALFLGLPAVASFAPQQIAETLTGAAPPSRVGTLGDGLWAARLGVRLSAALGLHARGPVGD